MKKELNDLNNNWRNLSDTSKNILETLETFTSGKPVRTIERSKKFIAFGREQEITNEVFDEIINYAKSNSCEFFKINIIEETDSIIKIQLQ